MRPLRLSSRVFLSAVCSSGRHVSSSASAAFEATTLLVHRGKVVAFETSISTPDGPGLVRQTTGFDSGDRLRSYAGARVGQFLTVVGLRNGALWVVWEGDKEPVGIAIAHLPRMDLRVVGHTTFEGLDRSKYSSGDSYYAPNFTEGSVASATRVSLTLDDASLQYSVNENAAQRSCQRCEERTALDFVRRCIKDLREAYFTTRRLERIFFTKTESLPALSSLDSINREIALVIKSVPSVSSPAEALQHLITQRVSQLDDYYKVRVLSQDYLFPRCCLQFGSTKYRVSEEPWVAELPMGKPVKPMVVTKGKEQTTVLLESLLGEGAEVDLGEIANCVCAQLSQFLRTSTDEGGEVLLSHFFTTLTPNSIKGGITAEGISWVKTALVRAIMSNPIFKDMSNSATSLQNHLISQGNDMDSRAILLSALLREELRALSEWMHVSEINGGFSGYFPVVALTTANDGEVQIKKFGWCEEVITSHPHIGAHMKNLAEHEEKLKAEQQERENEENEEKEEKDDETAKSATEYADAQAKLMFGAFGKEGTLKGEAMKIPSIDPTVASRLLKVCLMCLQNRLLFFSFSFSQGVLQKRRNVFVEIFYSNEL